MTRFRTAYRDATRMVTRYLPTPRVYTYEAVEHTGQYSCELSATLLLGTEGMPLLTEHRSQQQSIGLYHDVSFRPAGISPSRPALPTRDLWVQQQLAELQAKVAAALADSWGAKFCAAQSYTFEEAARCAHLSERLPPEQARKTLEVTFGNDTPLMLRLLDRKG